MTSCGASGCPGTTNRHTLDVTSWNPTTGVFTGRGWWNADPDVTWAATGSVTGTRFELAFTYDGAGAGYAADVVGALGEDGSLHFGLGTDNAVPTNHFAFEATAVPEPARAAAAAAAALALAALAARSRRRAEA